MDVLVHSQRGSIELLFKHQTTIKNRLRPRLMGIQQSSSARWLTYILFPTIKTSSGHISTRNSVATQKRNGPNISIDLKPSLFPPSFH
jgi:hypothetical protein